MTSSERIEFSEAVQFKAEPGLNRAVAAAARQARTTSSEYLRRALRAQLKADGVDLPPLGVPATQQAA